MIMAVEPHQEAAVRELINLAMSLAEDVVRLEQGMRDLTDAGWDAVAFFEVEGYIREAALLSLALREAERAYPRRAA